MLITKKNFSDFFKMYTVIEQYIEIFIKKKIKNLIPYLNFTYQKIVIFIKKYINFVTLK